MFRGDFLTLTSINSLPGLAELVIDQKGSSVNAIGQAFLKELGAVCDLLESDSDIRGLLISSAKSTFVAGADVFEFPPLLEGDPGTFQCWIEHAQQLFNRIESLPFPSVSAINGLALGGGWELALTTDTRVIEQSAKVGFPEVTLGLCPGWGGTVRASRIAGVDAALQLMVSGHPIGAKKALELGLVNESAPSDGLREVSIALLNRMIDGTLDHVVLRENKQQFAGSTDLETLKSTFTNSLNPDYPATREIIDLVAGHASVAFEDALKAERDTFQRLGSTTSTQSLIGLFINGQRLKQASKLASRNAIAVTETAVLGAGIMGGGIAYQSAITGIPVTLKDIRKESLDLGITTASKALDKLIKKGRMNQAGKSDCLGLINPTLEFDGFERVGLVVEAVVENEAVKRAVLAETEMKLAPDAILTSNTSTISITSLASVLKRPENFCGMHFFNPVPLMSLVEIIRGERSGEAAIATAVDCAVKMGKTPIVVNDCPGFLVNRVLFPYFNAFNRLLHESVDFQRIDQVMEDFGWPMGPACLADVIGLDTMVHADQVLQAGYPERMKHDNKPIIELLLEQGALGQKNGRGFYDYSEGPRKKQARSEALGIIRKNAIIHGTMTDQDIVDRMMIPLCLEAFRCLNEGIVGSAAEVDMGVILGLGFPKFRGGALRYIDHTGAKSFAAKVERWSETGPLYQVPDTFRAHCRTGKRFF